MDGGLFGGQSQSCVAVEGSRSFRFFSCSFLSTFPAEITE